MPRINTFPGSLHFADDYFGRVARRVGDTELMRHTEAVLRWSMAQEMFGKHNGWRLPIHDRNRQEARAVEVAAQVAPDCSNDWAHLLKLECGGLDYGWGSEVDDIGAPRFPGPRRPSWVIFDELTPYYRWLVTTPGKAPGSVTVTKGR